MRRALFAALCGALLVLPGCIVVSRTSKGREIDYQAVARIERGRTTLTRVLELLGTPHEVHNHADSRLLIYRHRESKGLRIELNPSQYLTFIDVSQTISLLSKLRLTLQWMNRGEDRVVILIDNDDVVQAVGSRSVTADLPVF